MTLERNDAIAMIKMQQQQQKTIGVGDDENI